MPEHVSWEGVNPYLAGIWVRCAGCDEFMCTIHDLHVSDCDCPALEEMPSGLSEGPCVPSQLERADG